MQRSGFNYSIAAIRSPTWPRYIPRCEASRVGSWLTECLMLQWNAENEIQANTTANKKVEGKERNRATASEGIAAPFKRKKPDRVEQPAASDQMRGGR